VQRFGVTDRHRDGSKRHRDIELAAPEMKISSRQYQKLVAKIEGKPEERILSYLMLRSLKQARYSTNNAGHFALAADTYTHFTSPIRRYPDLVIHRLLREALSAMAEATAHRSRAQRAPRQGAVATSLSEPELSAIATECSHTERRAAEAERELVEWKKVRFMADRVGEDFDALVISTAKYGIFVELTELFIEGLVPIDTLPGDEYTYRENVRKVVGKRTRREFSIGDRVRVVLVRIDANERKLQFGVFEEPKPRRRRPR
jgi:ribonuclease R